MPLRTKRWNDPVADEDGFRLLVCRLRPRGVAKVPWDEWWPELGPSRGLLNEFHGTESHAPLSWENYVPRYLEEMRAPASVWRLRALTSRLAGGEVITILCSAACTDEARCHRTLLATMLGAMLDF